MPPTETHPEIATEVRAQPGARVLVVDDDRNDLNHYSEVLDQAGYKVQSATSYVDAYCRVGSEPFDFIIANQGTDRLEWRAVVERATETPQHPPVLVMTRNRDMSSYRQAMEMGAVDYVEKPVKGTDLVRLVQSHLGGGNA